MKKLLVILVIALSIVMVGCGQETKASGNQNEAERKECVDSNNNDVQTIDDEYAQNLELNSKTNR